MNSSAKYSVRLTDVGQEASHCTVYLCGKITVQGAAKSSAILADKPRFRKKTYDLDPKSSLYGAGTDNDNIGLRKN